MTWITIIAVVFAVSIVGIVTMIVLAICKSGAISDFNFALMKCQSCKHYQEHNEQIREIYCNILGWRFPEEIQNCKKYDSKGTK